MKKSVLALAAATLLVSGGIASAATTTTTTWTDSYGNVFREYSTTRHYEPIVDPSVETRVGVELPSNVTLYDLPTTVTVPEPRQYGYVILNDHPVVVERSTRRIIHTW
jgi:hypothetical protein